MRNPSCFPGLPKSKIQNPKSKIQNPKSKIQNPKSKKQKTWPQWLDVAPEAWPAMY
jgi:hypothetical protein